MILIWGMGIFGSPVEMVMFVCIFYELLLPSGVPVLGRLQVSDLFPGFIM